MLIDDDAGERRALSRVLTAGGFAPATYASAEEFLASPPVETPVCMLVDIHLEGMSGLDLQDRLNCEGSHVPVIVITASDDPRARRRAEASGCIAFFRKPFEGRMLLDVVRSRAMA